MSKPHYQIGDFSPMTIFSNEHGVPVEAATACTKTLAKFIVKCCNEHENLAALRDAVGKLVKAKGRFHTQQSYEELERLYKATKGKP